MMPIVILAHGALGWWDEIIFAIVVIVFVGMMALSWFRSQQLPDDTDEQLGMPIEGQPDAERFELQ